ncbi:hypothetical protein C8F01DRAFT_1079550 [Mycena amicta]|nr:hypothetical protein C8F01DRAFT_1079550 [Mycena amicta]
MEIIVDPRKSISPIQDALKRVNRTSRRTFVETWSYLALEESGAVGQLCRSHRGSTDKHHHERIKAEDEGFGEEHRGNGCTDKSVLGAIALRGRIASGHRATAYDRGRPSSLCFCPYTALLHFIIRLLPTALEAILRHAMRQESKKFAVDGVLSAKAVWTRPRMDSAPVFQWVSISSRTGTALLRPEFQVYLVKASKDALVYVLQWSGYPLNACTWEPSCSFDPPYEEITMFWTAARLDGRDWMNMREFRNEDRVFLNADPAYASGVHNFRRYKVNQMERTPEGLAIPKELLKDIAAETALAAEYLCDVDEGRGAVIRQRMVSIGTLISSMVERAEARQ